MDQPAAAEHNRADRGQPDVAVILELDRDYRRQAEAGELPLGELPEKQSRWLPVLTRQVDPWRLTAICKDDPDKVIVYCRHARRDNVKRTFITTAKRGRLAGKRIIHGRRAECAGYYRHLPPGPHVLAGGTSTVATTAITESSAAKLVRHRRPAETVAPPESVAPARVVSRRAPDAHPPLSKPRTLSPAWFQTWLPAQAHRVSTLVAGARTGRAKARLPHSPAPLRLLTPPQTPADMPSTSAPTPAIKGAVKKSVTAPRPPARAAPRRRGSRDPVPDFPWPLPDICVQLSKFKDIGTAWYRYHPQAAAVAGVVGVVMLAGLIVVPFAGDDVAPSPPAQNAPVVVDSGSSDQGAESMAVLSSVAQPELQIAGKIVNDNGQPVENRYTEEQIVAMLWEAESSTVAATARNHGVAVRSIYRWRHQFAGMEVSEVRELRRLR